MKIHKKANGQGSGQRAGLGGQKLSGSIKKLSLLLALTIGTLLYVSGSMAASSQKSNKVTPLSIGGFTLGTSIDDYEFISYHNYLKEVVIENVGGFRKGVIEYGVCERPGQIVRIKLKYADSSKAYFNELMQRYKKRFGKPDAYRGDAFGITKAWKWEFFTSEGDKVSLLLQHNSKNQDETMGNMVKISMPDRMKDERLCFNAICEMKSKKEPVQKNYAPDDWSILVPQ